MRKVNGALIGSVLTPWAGREDQWDEPRYELARRDEPSMRNLIRAELIPRLSRWDKDSRTDLKVALALALHSETWRWIHLESALTPLLDASFGERHFWLWVWDELYHEDLPAAEDLVDFELIYEPFGDIGLRVEPGPEWHEIFEARKKIRFRWRP